MRLTIIKDDHRVYVDGVSYEIDCSGLPEDFHALQWDDNIGHVEYVKLPHMKEHKPNEIITDISAYQTYIDAHAKLAEQNKNQNTIPVQPHANAIFDPITMEWK